MLAMFVYPLLTNIQNNLQISNKIKLIYLIINTLKNISHNICNM